MFQISFIVRNKAISDETVFIVGDVPQLGLWDIGKGLPLHYDGQEWSTLNSIEIGLGKKFQFKLVKLYKDGGI
jgi:hypothetical protein